MSLRANAVAILVMLAIAVGWLVRPACGEDSTPPLSLDDSISKGLGFLAPQQNADGSFGTVQKPAITGLALMSFLSCGRTPNAGSFEANVGKFGSNVRGAIDYLLAQAQPDGSFGKHGNPMYCQAIATLALAEAYGVDDNEAQRKRIAAALTASAKLIVAAQDARKPDLYAGGWHVDVNSPESDLSVTAWNVVALHACVDVGINVPRSAFAKAAKFILKCYNPEAKGFAYQPGGTVQPGATSAAVLCLHLLDLAQRAETQSAEKLLSDKPDKPGDDVLPYDGLYFAALAEYQVGDAVWTEGSKLIFDKLMKAQQADGGWPDGASEAAGSGRVYATSMAVLTLSIQFRLLPAFQH